MSTMIKSMGLCGAAVMAMLTSAYAQSDATATKFLTDAIRTNIAEVKMGELAEQRGKSKDVRDFAKQLIEDHTLGLRKTSALAKTLGVTAPTEPGPTPSRATRPCRSCPARTSTARSRATW